MRQCLPDLVESYLGAIFVDSEFNYKEIERFFDVHMRWYFEDMSIYDTFANCHPTVNHCSPFLRPVLAHTESMQTHLSNLLTLSFGCNNYRLMSDELPSIIEGSAVRIIAVVMIHDQIIAEGTASSSKYAKLKASSNALAMLEGLAPFEYRIQYRCDCSEEKRGHDVEGGSLAEAFGSAV